MKKSLWITALLFVAIGPPNTYADGFIWSPIGYKWNVVGSGEINGGQRGSGVETFDFNLNVNYQEDQGGEVRQLWSGSVFNGQGTLGAINFTIPSSVPNAAMNVVQFFDASGEEIDLTAEPLSVTVQAAFLPPFADFPTLWSCKTQTCADGFNNGSIGSGIFSPGKILSESVTLATPEPGSVLLVGSGLAGVAALRRRKLAA